MNKVCADLLTSNKEKGVPAWTGAPGRQQTVLMLLLSMFTLLRQFVVPGQVGSVASVRGLCCAAHHDIQTNISPTLYSQKLRQLCPYPFLFSSITLNFSINIYFYNISIIAYYLLNEHNSYKWTL